MQCRRARHRAQDRLELRRSAEPVAAALHDKHRMLDGGQVFVAPLVRSSRRVQGIAEQHQSVNRQLRVGCGDMGGHASAHRLAADEQVVPGARHFLTCGVDDRSVAPLEDRTAIWNAAVLLGVREIECDDVETETGQSV